MMTEHSSQAAPYGSSNTFAVLTVTTLTLMATTWGTLLYTTAATVVMADFGFEATAIGYQVSLAYLSATVCSLYAGDITLVLGARMSLIFAMLLAGFGSLGTTVYGLYGMFSGAILIGAAHGLTNPASALLLQGLSTSGKRSFLFSIKQTGVPVGGLVTAVVTPAMTQNFHWHYAGYALSGACFSIAFLTWCISRKWGKIGNVRNRLSLNPFNSISVVLKSSGLLALALMAMCYACVQICIMTFMSPYLVEELGFTLIVAGTLVATAQIGGGIGRPFWGWLSDYAGKNVLVLRILGLVTSLGCLSLLVVSPSSPWILLIVLFFILGSTAIGWNGLFVAEIVNLADRGSAAQATAGVAAITFTSVMIGPSAFALIKKLSGEYSLTFAIFSIVGLIGVVLTFWLASSKTQIER